MIARACGMAALLAGGALLVQPREARPPEIPLRFVDVAAESGSRNVHRKPVFSSRFANIMPGMSALGAAVAAVDYDGDGRVDFYVTNSARGSGNRLFRNLGDGRFEDVAARAGVAACNREGVSMDAVFFDADNDGDQDLYVAVWGGANQLYENLGGGTFRDVTRRAGVGFQGYANGVVAFDYDRDGLLDLFVANYFPSTVADPVTGRPVRNDLWNPVTTRVMHSSFTHAANGGRNVLYRNQGDGTFRDVTAEAGLRHTGWSLDPGAGDLNNDGWPDLYVANDYGPDELYFNTGAAERPPRFRLAVDPDGHPGVGADWRSPSSSRSARAIPRPFSSSMTPASRATSANRGTSGSRRRAERPGSRWGGSWRKSRLGSPPERSRSSMAGQSRASTTLLRVWVTRSCIWYQ